MPRDTHDVDHDDDDTTADHDIEWFSPARYHTRCTPELTLKVARDIACGASWQSATKKYGVRHRALEWMRWGFDAAQRDVGPMDKDAPFLDWYLKLSQAIGYAEVAAQQAAYQLNPSWWLAHNPESAAEWGGVTLGVPLVAVAPSNAAAAEPALPALSVPDVRDVLKTLLASAPDAHVVDAATPDLPNTKPPDAPPARTEDTA